MLITMLSSNGTGTPNTRLRLLKHNCIVAKTALFLKVWHYLHWDKVQSCHTLVL